MRLERVLELEAQQGYQDKAVVGGIRQFVVYWVEQAREDAVDEADRALVEQVAEALVDYGRLPGSEARAQVINSLMEGLERRRLRLGNGVSYRQKRSAREKPAVAKRPPKKPPAVPQSVVKSKPPAEKPVQVEPPAEIEPDPLGLAQSVLSIKGVGPKIGEKLQRLGVTTILDLLYLFPRRYDDYTLMKPISKLQYGEQVTIIGTIWQTRAKRTRNNKVMVQSVISDGTGSVQITWFNQPWIVKQLPAGMQIVVSGKVEQFLGRPVFNSPEWEPLELEPLRTRRIVPVYPLTEGLGSGKMREIMKTAVSYWAPRVPDPLPRNISQRQRLYALPLALQEIHFPDSQETLHDARRRLTFDELFLLQLGMQNQRRQWRSQSGVPIDVSPGHVIQFRNALPFSFTGAQQRVIDEITANIRLDVPMNRLLQGDVGSGKTVVAAAAIYATVSAGAQAALMVPTEILSEQHYRGLSKLLAPLGSAFSLAHRQHARS